MPVRAYLFPVACVHRPLQRTCSPDLKLTWLPVTEYYYAFNADKNVKTLHTTLVSTVTHIFDYHTQFTACVILAFKTNSVKSRLLNVTSRLLLLCCGILIHQTWPILHLVRAQKTSKTRHAFHTCLWSLMASTSRRSLKCGVWGRGFHLFSERGLDACQSQKFFYFSMGHFGALLRIVYDLKMRKCDTSQTKKNNRKRAYRIRKMYPVFTFT